MITAVEIDMTGWDLIIQFANDLTLRVFCDHVPGNPGFDGNWELFQQDKVVSIGVGSVCEVAPRNHNN